MVGVVAMAVLAGTIRASRPVLAGIDPFWHWDLGRRILVNGLPARDPYSFLTQGQEWVLNQWGFDLLVGLVDALGGLWLVAVLAVILVATTYGLVGWQAWQRAPSLLTVFLLGLVVTSSMDNWALRGNLVSTVLLALLLRELLRPDGLRIWAVTLLLVVWANAHATYLLGVAVALAHVAGRVAVSTHRRDWLARGAGVLFAGLVAGVVTPYGPRYLTSSFTQLGRAGLAGITEWGPTRLTDLTNLPYALLLGLVLISLGVAARRRDLPDIAVIVFASLFGMAANRNVAAAGIVIVVVGAPYVRTAWIEVRGGGAAVGTRSPSRFDLALAGMIVLGGVGAVLTVLPPSSNIAAHTAGVPLSLTSALEAEARQVRLITTSRWAPALSTLTGDHVRTAVDGRVELFTDEQFDEYRMVAGAGHGWEDGLDAWCASDVVIPVGSPLDEALNASTVWTEVRSVPVHRSLDPAEARWYRRSQASTCPQ